jgi:uncharacterized protein YdeI (YjbR/CyaY-like superfamily)
MENKETDTFCPTGRQEWRQWLQENHSKKQSVWLIYYKMKAGKPTLSWSEAVDEALCFGWIDSKAVSIDDVSFKQFFCPRKPKSVWSKINKEKVRRLIDEGLMTPAGQRCIDLAKQNGYWTILDEVEDLVVPDDLMSAFAAKTGAKEFFDGLSPSVKKAALQWLVMAKRPETRAKRVEEIATRAHNRQKPVV